jgi:hypothetical protein
LGRSLVRRDLSASLIWSTTECSGGEPLAPRVPLGPLGPMDAQVGRWRPKGARDVKGAMWSQPCTVGRKRPQGVGGLVAQPRTASERARCEAWANVGPSVLSPTAAQTVQGLARARALQAPPADQRTQCPPHAARGAIL